MAAPRDPAWNTPPPDGPAPSSRPLEPGGRRTLLSSAGGWEGCAALPWRQASGIEWSMVWWSRVGDNLDTATMTVAQTGSTFSSPLAHTSPMGSFISISETFKSPRSHQPPGREGRGGQAGSLEEVEEVGVAVGRGVRGQA